MIEGGVMKLFAFIAPFILTGCVLSNLFVFQGDSGTKENLPVTPAELKEMAGYCMQVYEKDPKKEFSYMVKHDRGVTIIIIRGTDNVKNIGSDVDARPFKDRKLAATLHRGFRDAAEDIKNEIDKKVELNDTIYITGHSLGGAIAQIMGYWYHGEGKTVQIYTFGAPKVSTKYFGNTPQHFRVAMVNDPVPFVPIFPYIHSGINIDPETLNWRFTNDVGDVTKINAGEHSIGEYYKQLSKHLEL